MDPPPDRCQDLASTLASGGKFPHHSLMRNRHAWTERDEDGVKREVEASKERGRWRLRFKAAGDEHWTPLDPPSREVLETLRDILWRKYQRRRASHEDVVLADQMLGEANAP